MGSGYQSMSVADGLVMITSVMQVVRKDCPAKGVESVVMRGDSWSAIQWGINCRGAKGRSGRPRSWEWEERKCIRGIACLYALG